VLDPGNIGPCRGVLGLYSVSYCHKEGTVMINRKLLGVVFASAAVAVSAVPAGAATAGPVSLQMPGASTWGSLSAPAPHACDAAFREACK
jgi:hypothetical protein